MRHSCVEAWGSYGSLSWWRSTFKCNINILLLLPLTHSVCASLREKPASVCVKSPKSTFPWQHLRGVVGGGWLIPNKESIYLVWSLLVKMMLLYSDRQARIVSWATFGLRRGSFSRITHHLINIHPITPKWQRPVINLSLDYSESTVNVTSWHLEMFVGN